MINQWFAREVKVHPYPIIPIQKSCRFLIVSSRVFRYAMQIREFVFVELASTFVCDNVVDLYLKCHIS